MTYIKKIAISTALTLIASSAFAATGDTTTVSTATGTTAKVVSTTLELKTAPVLKSKTSSSVTLEWEKVEAAATYIVKYSKKSVATSKEENAQYDNETDPVTSTGTTVESLEPATTYYFSVVAVDKDNNESDTYSDELSVSTDAAGAVSATGTTTGLALVNVSAMDNKTITLDFSAPLSSDPVTVKITKTSDNSDVPTESTALDSTTPNKVNVKVATVLDPKSSYSVTVITAKDTTGANIQEGVNGIKEFSTPETLATAPELAAMNSASGVVMNNSGAQAPTPTDAPALPATGTKENLIIIASLLLSFGLVVTFRKRFAK